MTAGLYSVRNEGELQQMLASLAEDGFRIISVFSTPNEMMHVVAQKDTVATVVPVKEGIR